MSITERKDLAQGFASIAQAAAVGLTGAAGFIGLAFTWRNLRQTRESTQRTLELTEQGQITERFTRAIDQLGATDDDGNPRLEVRLGGIYALERIDKDSPERAYHSTVMEVLTAYVRENAPWPPRNTSKEASISASALKRVRASMLLLPPTLRRRLLGFLETLQEKRGTGKAYEGAKHNDTPDTQNPRTRSAFWGVYVDDSRRRENIPGPPADIQAILDVLGSREGDAVPDQGRHTTLNLRNTNIRGANLYKADLRRADLRGANLRNARLRQANLEGANLRKADLREAELGANLKYCDLVMADLRGANLILADLQHTDLMGADLRGALFGGPVAGGAAKLEEADLRGADLRGAPDLAPRQLAKTKGDIDTKLPEGIHRPPWWTPYPEWWGEFAEHRDEDAQ